ncbi:hypothetical protein Tdes44962_MAKER07293 [Teratosphaeria destructans]|uniref:Uncharacterized protein n=1 Tax=Teratosphaeria destructans TaxID=418781 RepID=A0A9W7W616_9PEZI|nr:hypothetical protein Tdes44962_MAKER07293 [Teratosphaeria destructans]
MTALRPTPPRPRMRTTSAGVVDAALMTVPEPVWMPQPRGEKRASSCLLRTRSLALTTLHSFTMERAAKELWPKKAPPISGSPDLDARPKILSGPPKFCSLKLTQWDLWPAVQTSHVSQKAKERRTGSPGFATVTPGPTSLT